MKEHAMPVEIRELVIRASVADGAAKDLQLQAALARLKREIFAQCMDKIEQHIERSTER